MVTVGKNFIGPLDASAEETIRHFYNNVLAWAVDHSFTGTEEPQIRDTLKRLVRKGQGIQVHEQTRKLWALKYIGPPIELHATYPIGPLHPVVINYGMGTYKVIEGVDAHMNIDYKSRTVDAISFANILLDPNLVFPTPKRKKV